MPRTEPYANPRETYGRMDYLGHLQKIQAPPSSRLVEWQVSVHTNETCTERRSTFVASPQVTWSVVPLQCVVCNDRCDGTHGQVHVEALGHGDLSWLCVCSGCLSDSPVDQKNVTTLPKHLLQHHSE